MCMFDNPPKRGVIKETWVWKMFRVAMKSGKLSYLYGIGKPERGRWLKATAPNSLSVESYGFHVFLARRGAEGWRWPSETKKALRVKVRGRVFGTGKNSGYRGLRVEQMYIPKKG